MMVILGLVLALSPYKDAHPFVGALKLIRNDEHAQLPPSIMVKASERAGATYSLQGEH
jgi:hypothetical protein